MSRLPVAAVLVTALLAATPADAKRLKIVGTTAKSEYDEGDVSYPAKNIKDAKSETAWYEGEPGNGLGAWVEADLGATHTVKKIVVYAGDWKSESDWKRANRPKEIELKFSDESVETWTLEDSYVPQTWSGSKDTATIRFRIKSIYNGSAFPDTGISEIQIFDDVVGGPTVSSAEASTEFAPDGDYYYAKNASDGLLDTFWCEGSDGDGVGEWVQLNFSGGHPLSKMTILNGMGGSLSLYKKGNAATGVTLQFSDGSTKAIRLKDFPMPQPVSLGGVSTSSVKIRIDTVRKGSEYNDLCLAEVVFE